MSAEIDCDAFVLELLNGDCKAAVVKDEVLGDKINLRLKIEYHGRTCRHLHDLLDQRSKEIYRLKKELEQAGLVNKMRIFLRMVIARQRDGRLGMDGREEKRAKKKRSARAFIHRLLENKHLDS